MKFINEEDLTWENFELFCHEVESMIARHESEKKCLKESVRPQFNSTEEANRYYNAMPFQKWENKIFEEYGIKW